MSENAREYRVTARNEFDRSFRHIPTGLEFDVTETPDQNYCDYLTWAGGKDSTETGWPQPILKGEYFADRTRLQDKLRETGSRIFITSGSDPHACGPPPINPPTH